MFMGSQLLLCIERQTQLVDSQRMQVGKGLRSMTDRITYTSEEDGTTRCPHHLRRNFPSRMFLYGSLIHKLVLSKYPLKE